VLGGNGAAFGRAPVSHPTGAAGSDEVEGGRKLSPLEHPPCHLTRVARSDVEIKQV